MFFGDCGFGSDGEIWLGFKFVLLLRVFFFGEFFFFVVLIIGDKEVLRGDVFDVEFFVRGLFFKVIGL